MVRIAQSDIVAQLPKIKHGGQYQLILGDPSSYIFRYGCYNSCCNSWVDHQVYGVACSIQVDFPHKDLEVKTWHFHHLSPIGLWLSAWCHHRYSAGSWKLPEKATSRPPEGNIAGASVPAPHVLGRVRTWGPKMYRQPRPQNKQEKHRKTL